MMFDTLLSDDEEKEFQKWKAHNAPNDSGYDYDLRGAYKNGSTKDSMGHWEDTYKKPNHPTFSTESKYAVGDQRKHAGHWEGNKFVPAHDLLVT
jgi:hypothetical protein